MQTALNAKKIPIFYTRRTYFIHIAAASFTLCIIFAAQQIKRKAFLPYVCEMD